MGLVENYKENNRLRGLVVIRGVFFHVRTLGEIKNQRERLLGRLGETDSQEILDDYKVRGENLFQYGCIIMKG